MKMRAAILQVIDHVMACGQTVRELKHEQRSAGRCWSSLDFDVLRASHSRCHLCGRQPRYEIGEDTRSAIPQLSLVNNFREYG